MTKFRSLEIDASGEPLFVGLKHNPSDRLGCSTAHRQAELTAYRESLTLQENPPCPYRSPRYPLLPEDTITTTKGPVTREKIAEALGVRFVTDKTGRRFINGDDYRITFALFYDRPLPEEVQQAINLEKEQLVLDIDDTPSIVDPIINWEKLYLRRN